MDETTRLILEVSSDDPDEENSTGRLVDCWTRFVSDIKSVEVVAADAAQAAPRRPEPSFWACSHSRCCRG
jgi:hypothetical protein